MSAQAEPVPSQLGIALALVGSVSVGSLKFGNSCQSLLSQSRGILCDGDLAGTFDMRHSTVNCRNELS